MTGIWKLTLGASTEEGLLALTGARVDESLISESPCPLRQARISCEQVRERFVLRIPHDPAQRLYGLGLSFRGMALNHRVRHLRADHYGGSDNGRTHAPVPFYLCDRGYGVLIDTAENVSFYMGGAVRTDAVNPPLEMNRGRDADWRCDQDAEFVEASFIGTGVDVYLIAGETLKAITAQFVMLCGGGCLPPKWGLGFWHRVHIRHDEAAVLSELNQFREHGLHVDVLGLEPGWQSNSYPCSLEWDRERFPDPESFVSRLKASGTRVNLWENMYISRSSSLYKGVLPLCGSHQVWGGAVPDVTLPEAREMLLRHHERENAGVSGYKIDECDGYDEWLWPDHAAFPSGRSATALRNVYGARIERLLTDMFRARNERTYGLVRASNAGASSLPFCIYNDCYDFRQFLTGLATAGLCGVLWTPEVRNASSSEEWVRRFQLAALSPLMMLNAWFDGTKPWSFPEAEDAVADTIRLRRALLPYLYDAFHTYKAQGIPPFRPLVMDYTSEKRLADIVDQYLIGESLMAAPMTPGQSERDVVLPPGRWYDFYTGAELTSSAIRYACPLERAPLFVRGGGMIPLLQEDGSLFVRCFGERGERTLYDDDGVSWNFERGECAVLRMSFSRTDGRVQGRWSVESHGWASAYTHVEFA